MPYFDFKDSVKSFTYQVDFGPFVLLEGIGSTWGLFEANTAYDSGIRLDRYCRGTEVDCQITTSLDKNSYSSVPITLFSKDQTLFAKVPLAISLKKLQVEIFQLDGKCVFQKILRPNGNQEIRITDISSFPNQLYFVKIGDEGKLIGLEKWNKRD